MTATGATLDRRGLASAGLLVAALVGLVLLVAGSASAKTVFSDDFNDGVIDTTKWPETSGVAENDDCGAVSEPHSLKFQSDGDRFAETRSLDVAGGGEIRFELRKGKMFDWTCNDPEEGEELLLQYSTDDGVSWTTFASYAHDVRTEWTTIVEEIPVDAATTATRFRWSQPSHPGGDGFNDNWAIDDLRIEAVTSRETATGSISFDGNARLDAFPCDPEADRDDDGKAHDGRCEGTFSANVTGALAGQHRAANYTVAFNTEEAGALGFDAALTGEFTYEEDCSGFNPLGLARGEADGTGAVEIPSTAVEGRYRPPNTGLGHDVDGVRMSFTFEWDRVGNQVAIDLTDVTVEIQVDTGPDKTWKTVISDGRMRAVATFVPVPHTDGDGDVPTCDDPIPVDGLFAGELAVAHPDPT